MWFNRVDRKLAHFDLHSASLLCLLFCVQVVGLGEVVGHLTTDAAAHLGLRPGELLVRRIWLRQTLSLFELHGFALLHTCILVRAAASLPTCDLHTL